MTVVEIDGLKFWIQPPYGRLKPKPIRSWTEEEGQQYARWCNEAVNSREWMERNEAARLRLKKELG
jgi:hypothetical protein